MDDIYTFKKGYRSYNSRGELVVIPDQVAERTCPQRVEQRIPTRTLPLGEIVIDKLGQHWPTRGN